MIPPEMHLGILDQHDFLIPWVKSQENSFLKKMTNLLKVSANLGYRYLARKTEWPIFRGVGVILELYDISSNVETFEEKLMDWFTDG